MLLCLVHCYVLLGVRPFSPLSPISPPNLMPSGARCRRLDLVVPRYMIFSMFGSDLLSVINVRAAPMLIPPPPPPPTHDIYGPSSFFAFSGPGVVTKSVIFDISFRTSRDRRRA